MTLTAIADEVVTDRLPPQSLTAEKFVLGSMFRDQSLVSELTARLLAEDFYLHAHRRIFEAITRLSEAGRPVDLVTVFESLRSTGDAEDSGGAPYLAQLFDSAPTGAGWEYHAGIVREKSALRAGFHAAIEAAREFHEGHDPALEIAARLTTSVDRVVSDRDAGDALSIEQCAAEGLADYERRRDRTAPRLFTGFAEIDRLTGGFEPGQFIVVGARPSVGKSALGLAFGINASLLYSIPTLVVSLEMSRHEIGQRAVAYTSGASAHRLRSGHGTDSDWVAIRHAKSDLAKAPLHIMDRPNQRVVHIEATIRRMRRKHNIGLVIIDYLQLLTPDNPRDQRREQVAQMSRSLKLMGRRLDVTVVAMAQLGRQADERPDGPLMADFREAGDIEQDGDIVILLWRRPDQPNDADTWRIGCKIEKQRNGPTSSFDLKYRRSSMRFEDDLPQHGT